MFGLGKDGRDLDQVIFDIAEHQRPGDHERLFRLLRGRELYVRVLASSIPSSGQTHVVGTNDVILVEQARLPNGLRCAAFFVHKSDARLGLHFVAMTSAEAFRMVERSPDLDALLIQNARQSWVAFLRAELPRIREKLS